LPREAVRPAYFTSLSSMTIDQVPGHHISVLKGPLSRTSAITAPWVLPSRMATIVPVVLQEGYGPSSFLPTLLSTGHVQKCRSNKVCINHRSRFVLDRCSPPIDLARLRSGATRGAFGPPLAPRGSYQFQKKRGFWSSAFFVKPVQFLLGYICGGREAGINRIPAARRGAT
jgi:hypothetical protein